ncbi:MAG: pentapeptide repeat-containing protein [Nitrospirota bacterium]|nr:pentapeptide repeat-containing protein [Nitrospirota bacterium]
MRPRVSSDPLYQLLREEKISDFNNRRNSGEKADFTNCDFRGLDLRGLNAAGLDFSGSYFRQADMRGVDLSQSNLQGASVNKAQVSGTLFPQELSAEEIRLSLEHGTRLRYRA